MVGLIISNSILYMLSKSVIDTTPSIITLVGVNSQILILGTSYVELELSQMTILQ